MTEKELSQAVKDELSNIKKTDRLIQQMLNTISGLRTSLTSTSTQLKPDKVQTSHRNDQMAETVAKIVDFEKEINQYIDDLVDQKRKAFRTITTIPDPDQQNVLIARYINLKSWDDIASEFEHEVRWVYALHGKAIQAFLQSKNSAT